MKGQVRRGDEMPGLTPIELELLSYLVRHRGQALTPAQIVERNCSHAPDLECEKPGKPICGDYGKRSGYTGTAGRYSMIPGIGCCLVGSTKQSESTHNPAEIPGRDSYRRSFTPCVYILWGGVS